MAEATAETGTIRVLDSNNSANNLTDYSLNNPDT